MKRKMIFVAVITALAAFAAIIPLFPAGGHGENAAAEASAHGGYMLREYGGIIGVFSAGGSEPISVIDVDVRTLPEADRRALASGVFAADEDELNRRIEDYSS